MSDANDCVMKALDLDAVQAFVLVAEFSSFTRAAEALGTTQSAVSLRLRKLEERLKFRLLDRTPRTVRLSPEGMSFLERARDLLAAHDRALNQGASPTRRLKIGISDHVAGPELPMLLSRISALDSRLLLEVQIDSSANLLNLYDKAELDAVLIRRCSGERRDGELLFEDDYGWFASPSYAARSSLPIRLATVRSQCGIRALATRVLDAAGIPWIDAFLGAGVAAVSAAISAGIGVAPLARRIAPPSVVDVGPLLSLPELPDSQVILFATLSANVTAEVQRILSATFRSIAKSESRRGTKIAMSLAGGMK